MSKDERLKRREKPMNSQCTSTNTSLDARGPALQMHVRRGEAQSRVGGKTSFTVAYTLSLHGSHWGSSS